MNENLRFNLEKWPSTYKLFYINYSTSFEVHKHTMQLASYQHLLTCELIWLNYYNTEKDKARGFSC